MIREINHDPKFLSQKAVLATPKDDQIVTDLLDTLQANQARCVGMAANMIGENKQIIVCQMGPLAFPMLNPKIIKKRALIKQQKAVFHLKRQQKRHAMI